jgi:secreted trypsin-like serine protease
VSPRIVHGSEVTDMSQFPFQVALFNPVTSPDGSQFCGGVVFSATQVLTAAHCVVDFGTANLGSPSTIAVFAGAPHLSDTGPDAVISQAQTLSIDSHYDPTTNDHDIALIDLATPLWTGSLPATINKIDPIDDSELDPLLNSTATATVSGWGCTAPVEPGSSSCDAALPDRLQEVDVPLVKQSDCVSDYAVDSTPITDNMICAGAANLGADANTDSCFGDSGGPLTVDDPDTPGTKVLAGLVDAGEGCAQDGFPGIYTRVSKLTAFIKAADPSLGTPPPSLSGDAEVGQTVTCDPGNWTGDPAFSSRLMRDRGGAISAVTAFDATNTFTVPATAGGANMFCEVVATGTEATRSADSAEVSVPPAPVPPPPPPVAPPVAPTGKVDKIAPRLRVARKTCTKISCTLKLTITDASPSSGIAKVKATLGYTRKVRCRTHGKRTKCTKHLHRALSATGGKGGKFTIVVKRLTPGTGYRITLVPFDKAGNRPQFSTITSIRTKPRHQSLLG